MSREEDESWGEYKARAERLLEAAENNKANKNNNNNKNKNEITITIIITRQITITIIRKITIIRQIRR